MDKTMNALKFNVTTDPSLTTTYNVTASDSLHKLYEANRGENAPVKVAISIVNAILNHRLMYFTITPNEALLITQADRNWPLKTNVRLHHANEAIESLINAEVIEVLVDASASQQGVYKVIDDTLLTEIDPTIEELEANQAMIEQILI